MWVPMFSISSFPRWLKIFFGCSQALPSWQGWASLLPFFPSHPSGLQKVQALVAKWWISVCDISHFLQLCPWRKGPSSKFLSGAAWEPWKSYWNERIWVSLLKNGAPRHEVGLLHDECGLGLLLLAALDCSCLVMPAAELSGTGGTGVTSRAEGSMALGCEISIAPRGLLGESRPWYFVTAVFGGRALFCKKSLRVLPECDTWWVFCF